MDNIPKWADDPMGSKRPFIRERVEAAYQILDGIPEHRIDLYLFTNEEMDSVLRSWGLERLDKVAENCGTLACGAGWLSLHPKFHKWGLTADRQSGYPKATDRNGIACTAFDAVDVVFLRDKYQDTMDSETDSHYTRYMFHLRRAAKWDEYLFDYVLAELGTTLVSDKDLLLLRLKYAHQHHSA
jgi:hypothetical protein